MAVKLRLRRLGRTHSPFYHIVAADSRSPRDGKVIEQVGTYSPLSQPAEVVVDHSKALKWLKNGAQPTETVRSILSHEGLMLKLHLHRKGKNEAEVEAGFEAWKQGKELRNAAHKNTIEQRKHAVKQARLTAEQQRRAAIAAKVAAKNTPPAEAAAEVADVVEAAAEATAEAPAEASAENA